MASNEYTYEVVYIGGGLKTYSKVVLAKNRNEAKYNAWLEINCWSKFIDFARSVYSVRRLDK